MKKFAAIIACVVVAMTGFTPAAYARHKARHVVAAPVGNPRIDPLGQFYATPVQAGDPSLALIPGLGIAGGVVEGATQPVVLPNLDIPDLALLTP